MPPRSFSGAEGRTSHGSSPAPSQQVPRASDTHTAAWRMATARRSSHVLRRAHRIADRRHQTSAFAPGVGPHRHRDERRDSVGSAAGLQSGGGGRSSSPELALPARSLRRGARRYSGQASFRNDACAQTLGMPVEVLQNRGPLQPTSPQFGRFCADSPGDRAERPSLAVIGQSQPNSTSANFAPNSGERRLELTNIGPSWTGLDGMCCEID